MILNSWRSSHAPKQLEAAKRFGKDSHAQENERAAWEVVTKAVWDGHNERQGR
jgi:hypothetical protein